MAKYFWPHMRLKRSYGWAYRERVLLIYTDKGQSAVVIHKLLMYITATMFDTHTGPLTPLGYCSSPMTADPAHAPVRPSLPLSYAVHRHRTLARLRAHLRWFTISIWETSWDTREGRRVVHDRASLDILERKYHIEAWPYWSWASYPLFEEIMV